MSARAEPLGGRAAFWARACALALGGCATVAAGGCAALQPGPPSTAFRIDTNVPEATVYVDDVFIGRASEWNHDGRLLRAGFHRVELRDPDHYPFYAEIKGSPGGAAVVSAVLQARVE